MRVVHAIAGMMIFVFIMYAALGDTMNTLQISDNAIWLSLALVFAGGMAGGGR